MFESKTIPRVSAVEIAGPRQRRNVRSARDPAYRYFYFVGFPNAAKPRTCPGVTRGDIAAETAASRQGQCRARIYILQYCKYRTGPKSRAKR